MHHKIGYHVHAEDTHLYISLVCKQPLEAISKLNSGLVWSGLVSYTNTLFALFSALRESSRDHHPKMEEHVT